MQSTLKPHDIYVIITMGIVCVIFAMPLYGPLIFGTKESKTEARQKFLETTKTITQGMLGCLFLLLILAVIVFGFSTLSDFASSTSTSNLVIIGLLIAILLSINSKRSE